MVLAGAEYTPASPNVRLGGLNLPMEVKSILEKIRQKESKPSEYYFALEIGFDSVRSAIFLIEENQVKVLSLGDKERWQDEDELIEAVDASLSSASEKLPVEGEVKEPEKVVFGLPFTWVEGDKIIEDKLKLLKTLSEKLDLKPTGFVVTTEAITHHLKTTEGIPPTVILVYLGLKQIIVSLIRIGKIFGPKIIDRSENLADDLIEGLSRFEAQEPLPARILIYDGSEEIEEARQQLVSYPWLEKRKEAVEFLHLPKTEILSPDFDIEAIAMAGGKEVAKAAGLILEEKPIEKKEEEVKEEEAEIKEEVEEEGFVSAEELGFVRGKDVVGKRTYAEEKEVIKEEPELPEEKIPAEEKPVSKSRLSFFVKSFLSRISWLKKINLSFFKGLVSSFPQTRPTLILVLGLFLIFAGGLLAAYWYFPQAKITLYLEPEILEKEFTIKLDPNVSVLDKENFILPAQKIEIEVEGKKTKTTTGSKEIGDPAKGEVTIYNGTSSEKIFKSGITIKSLGGLEFTLDNEVKVASQSSAAEPPGKAMVKATAVKIGTEGNLAAGTEFTIANFAKSDFVAKNDSAFGGGTSRQIQAVSKEDEDALLADLKANLEEEGKNKLITQISSEQKLVEKSITSQVIRKEYNHQVGDETESLELSLKLKSTAMVYTDQELSDLVEDSVRASVTEGFEYKPGETEFSFDLEKVNKDGSATFKAYLKAKLIPKLDLEQIKRNLAGKYLVIGRAYLSNLPKIGGFEAEIFPQLPGRLGTFPRVANRIQIKIETR